MFYKQTPVKITGYGLAAGCQVFYRKIYGFLLQWVSFSHVSDLELKDYTQYSNTKNYTKELDKAI